MQFIEIHRNFMHFFLFVLFFFPWIYSQDIDRKYYVCFKKSLQFIDLPASGILNR